MSLALAVRSRVRPPLSWLLEGSCCPVTRISSTGNTTFHRRFGYRVHGSSMESVHPCPPASRRHHRGVSSVVIPSGHRALAHIARVPLSGIARPIHGLGQTLSPRRPPSPRASHSLLLTTRTPTCSDPSIRSCVASSLHIELPTVPPPHNELTWTMACCSVSQVEGRLRLHPQQAASLAPHQSRRQHGRSSPDFQCRAHR
ncbi:hypothetical protein GQ55_7G082200 [Panicum hallii var. hallii]|uniref:Uncharacterized protein n=1 Tax=Panicum hallii var. hallii TaxID=1504633 RepID=A0A2T7CT00_9POAL|nr:hypothetical protein GQ55_7G082200 [Panicum hallii var. hallii]